MFRTERDSLGEMQVPVDALYGIHSLRARENFPYGSPFHSEWYMAMGITKLACYNTYRRFRNAATGKYGDRINFRMIDDTVLDALCSSAKDIAGGEHFNSFVVPAIQGGAGTSINMNVNEIITNTALVKTGSKPGNYELIDPVEHANIFQSTNDVVPTALTVAVMRLLNTLEEKINLLRAKTEKLEKDHRDKLRPGYTQMQEAVPSSFGLLFSSYNDALSRDWWRVSKCFERIRNVNLGGGATGTGMAVPRFFIMEVIPELRDLTGLQLAHSENLSDNTSNLDRWVEIHATLKAHAVNLEKIASDLRLLSSDIAGNKLLTLPPKQVGSSIMPGKINPVIPEFIISASHKIYSNDQLISSLSGLGCLELNAYLPVLGHTLIESLKLMIAADVTLLSNMLEGIEINSVAGLESLMKSPSLATALVPVCGYNKATALAKYMKENGTDIFEANRATDTIAEPRLRELLLPGNLLKLGFSLEDLL